MAVSKQQHSCAIGHSLTAVLVAAAFLLLAFSTPAATAQTFTVLHTFTGGADGATPEAGLIMDRGGKLYGTTSAGAAGFGTAFSLTPSGSSWRFNSLYTFSGGADGGSPMAALTIGPDGALYGTAAYGGNVSLCQEPFWTGCGVVFELQPPQTPPRAFLSPWTETVLYQFSFTDGALPFSEVIFDASGNLYGTTEGGGLVDAGSGEDCGYHCGVVYELSKTNGRWSLAAEYLFMQYYGSNPTAGLVFDQQGNLYGATSYTGPSGYGTIFRLTRAGSGFNETTLHAFYTNDGGPVFSTPVIDSAGNLYAGNPGYRGLPANYDGTLLSLTPSGGYSELYSFPPADGPYGGLAMDAAGNLYGTTGHGGTGNGGSVFKLTPSNGGWIYTDLHDFQSSEGCDPTGKLLVDAAGNIYGTTSRCAASYGTVWEITP